MTARVCAHCGGSMKGKKSNAVTCSIACNHARLAARRKAEKWEGVDPNRGCETCGVGMKGRRPHAKFCSRSCKTKASESRRIVDGRDKLKQHARRAKVRYGSVCTTDIDRLRARQRGYCFYCSKKMKVEHLEHVIPLSRGGKHSLGNIVLACSHCNHRKSDKFVMEWRTGKKRR
jgi:5-methylcytosine-specific restriction endonuclease McrA